VRNTTRHQNAFHRPSIQTLERLHSELGCQILENKSEALRLAESMRHVEAVIKMLDPTFNLRRIAVKRRRSDKAARADLIGTINSPCGITTARAFSGPPRAALRGGRLLAEF
jgi:hypothetical protein